MCEKDSGMAKGKQDEGEIPGKDINIKLGHENK